MNAELVSEPLERFRNVIAHRFGLAIEPSRLAGASELLERHAKAHGVEVAAYVERMEASWPDAEIAGLIPELTVSETYFFRHSQQFDALRALLAGPVGFRTPGPSLLCAGCATGEEAFSLAIAVREVLPLRTPSILAVDLNPAALARAREGRFSAWALRETPASSRARWFRHDGKLFHLDPSIREAVRFRHSNLAAPDPVAYAPGTYDVIFCRNVLMYFTPDQSRAAIARLHEALAPGGHLFLGSAETLRELSLDFDLCQAEGAFYYRKKSGAARDAASTLAVAGPWKRPIAQTPAEEARVASGADSPLETEAEWASAIARATARVSALSRSGVRRSEPALSQRKALLEPSSALREPMELLRRERFDEALSLVRALQESEGVSLDVLLLEAVLASSGGRLDEARSACRRLLAADELNAGAHYVLALCDAESGSGEDAIRHHRIATSLDPHFAMPRLQLGLLLRRAGQKAQARGELMHALALLEHEDAERLTLFGGGFGRSALLELCASELAAAGVEP